MGLGFAWLPEHLAQELAQGLLCILPIEPDNIRFADLYFVEAHKETQR